MKVRFLLDENLSPRLKVAVLRFNPAIDILRVGDRNTPQLGTLDPDVLRYLELSQRLLVTDNRTSMREHLEAHWADFYTFRPNPRSKYFLILLKIIFRVYTYINLQKSDCQKCRLF